MYILNYIIYLTILYKYMLNNTLNSLHRVKGQLISSAVV